MPVQLPGQGFDPVPSTQEEAAAVFCAALELFHLWGRYR